VNSVTQNTEGILHRTEVMTLLLQSYWGYFLCFWQIVALALRQSQFCHCYQEARLQGCLCPGVASWPYQHDIEAIEDFHIEKKMSNDDTDGWKFAADVAFKCFCIAQYFLISSRPPCTILTSQRQRLQKASIAKRWLSYTLKLVIKLNFTLLFVLAHFLAFCGVNVSCNSDSVTILFTFKV